MQALADNQNCIIAQKLDHWSLYVEGEHVCNISLGQHFSQINLTADSYGSSNKESDEYILVRVTSAYIYLCRNGSNQFFYLVRALMKICFLGAYKVVPGINLTCSGRKFAAYQLF